MSTMQREDQLRVKQLLSDAIKILCKNGLSYQAEFSIEGLLGITLDQKDIFLVNIKENVKYCKESESKDEDCEITQAVGHLLTNSSTVSLSDAASKDLDMTINLTSEVSTSGNKDIGMPPVIQIMDDEEIDHENLNFNISDMDVSLKYNDLDLFLSNFAGHKKSESDKDEAPGSDSIFSSLEIDQIINKANADQSKDDQGKDSQSVDESEEEASDSDVVVVKQVGTRLAKKRKLGESLEDIQATVSVVAESPISISATPDSGVDWTKDIELPGCSTWPAGATTEDAETDSMPLNLTPVAQDLSTKRQETKENGKPKKHMCDECGKNFKSENSMKKHKDKEHFKFVGAATLLKDAPEPLNLIRQPLDLTIRSDLEEGELIITEGTRVELMDQETFTCVCRKEYSDYETYVEHATSCTKSKLTPYKSCETCGKYFFSSSGYIKHRRLHLGAYKFHCRLCHKGFFDRTHLGAHMDSSHSKVRRFECSHCVKRFFWKHHLKRHLATCGNARLGTSIVKCEEPVDEEESLD